MGQVPRPTPSGSYDRQTAAVALAAGTPTLVTLDGLSGNTQCYYRLYFQSATASSATPTDEHSHSVPVFLVNGNHEGEAGWLSTGTGQDITVWTTHARQQYYLNPAADDFYSGDTTDERFVGLRAAWYAWQWGDALFVVLDPFWYSTVKSNTDGWVITLGETQYRWLAQILADSQAKFKFVFIHNLVGGLDGQMRGGIEAAPYFEWGGLNADGSYGFDQKRPGWGRPIHQILVESGVTAVFHGHDHLYDKQDLDGIVYQEVPQPSAKNSSSVKPWRPPTTMRMGPF